MQNDTNKKELYITVCEETGDTYLSLNCLQTKKEQTAIEVESETYERIAKLLQENNDNNDN